MNEIAVLATEEAVAIPADLYSLPRFELELLAMRALHQHRRGQADDAAFLKSFRRAIHNPSIAKKKLRRLRDEYLARQMRAQDEADTLCRLVDVLGYVPDTPL